MTQPHDLKCLMEKALDEILSGEPHTAEVLLELALDRVYAEPETAAERDRLKAINAELVETAKVLIDQIEDLQGESSVIDEDLMEGEPLRMVRAAIATATKEG